LTHTHVYGSRYVRYTHVTPVTRLRGYGYTVTHTRLRFGFTHTVTHTLPVTFVVGWLVTVTVGFGYARFTHVYVPLRLRLRSCVPHGYVCWLRSRYGWTVTHVVGWLVTVGYVTTFTFGYGYGSPHTHTHGLVTFTHTLLHHTRLVVGYHTTHYHCPAPRFTHAHTFGWLRYTVTTRGLPHTLPTRFSRVRPVTTDFGYRFTFAHLRLRLLPRLHVYVWTFTVLVGCCYIYRSRFTLLRSHCLRLHTRLGCCPLHTLDGLVYVSPHTHALDGFRFVVYVTVAGYVGLLLLRLRSRTRSRCQLTTGLILHTLVVYRFVGYPV